MKRIAIFGSTGRTGKIFLQKALQHGYQVKTLVRNAEKVKLKTPEVEVIEGNILDEDKVGETIKDCELVVSLIGHVKDSPGNLQSFAMENILSAMKMHGISRLISLTGGGVRDRQHDKPRFPDKLIVFIMRYIAGRTVKNALLDGNKHAQIIRESDVDWTIVRAPMLTDKPEQGKWEVGYVGTVKGISLTRADLAQFILDECRTGEYIKQMPFVTNGK